MAPLKQKLKSANLDNRKSGMKKFNKNAISSNDILLLHGDYVALENLFLFIYYFDFDWIDVI